MDKVLILFIFSKWYYENKDYEINYFEWLDIIERKPHNIVSAIFVDKSTALVK